VPLYTRKGAQVPKRILLLIVLVLAIVFVIAVPLLAAPSSGGPTGSCEVVNEWGNTVALYCQVDLDNDTVYDCAQVWHVRENGTAKLTYSTC